MKHYSNVYRRALRISGDVEKLIKRIDELEEACKKLREAHEADLAREVARERVLEQLQEKLDG